MKTPKIIALALSLFGASLASASAATVDYLLNVPLVGITDSTAAGFLTGTLALDDDALQGLGEGSGTFTFLRSSDGFMDTRDYSGWASMLPMETATGLYFDADGVGGGHLYFNLLTTAFGDASTSGSVTFCDVNQTCSLYSGVGASLIQAGLPPVTVPGSGTGIGVSPVPLPPALWMFGGALLVLAGRGAAGRLRHAEGVAKRRRL